MKTKKFNDFLQNKNEGINYNRFKEGDIVIYKGVNYIFRRWAETPANTIIVDNGKEGTKFINAADLDEKNLNESESGCCKDCNCQCECDNCVDKECKCGCHTEEVKESKVKKYIDFINEYGVEVEPDVETEEEIETEEETEEMPSPFPKHSPSVEPAPKAELEDILKRTKNIYDAKRK